jgi:hypothetical protein
MKADPDSPLLAIRCELMSIQRRLDAREVARQAHAGDRPVPIAVVAEVEAPLTKGRAKAAPARPRRTQR